jgi:putative Mg2+ transporter-C (MgtC) family protein
MPLHPTWQDIAIRLILTVIAGAAIGLNREARGHAAGFRTTILVGLAAAISMIQANILLSVEGKAPGSFATMDILRFPLGVLTGVGFIGGGAILKRGALVTGVTTAATMWVMTAIGLCIGGGQLIIGSAATVLVLVVLAPLKHLDSWMPHKQKGRVVIEVDAREKQPELQSLLEKQAKVYFAGKRKTDEETTFSFELRWQASGSDNKGERILEAIEQRYKVALFEISDETD